VTIQKIAVLLESHWPGLQVTEVDMAALSEAFKRYSVTYDEAVDAIFAIANDGERYQPRAPQILSKVRDIRRECARERSFDRALERGNETRMPTDELKAQVKDLLKKIKSV